MSVALSAPTLANPAIGAGSSAARRRTACRGLLRQAHAILDAEGPTPSGLHAIKKKLVALAKRADLFQLADFPMPEAEGRSHILEVEDDDGLGLYLTIGLPGKEAAPHDHGIWCVNAGVSGRERHVFYRRIDENSPEGHAEVVRVGEVVVEPGTGMAMADHDIHATEVIGDAPAIGLALYGYALTRFPAVVWYHPGLSSVRTCASRRAARPALAGE